MTKKKRINISLSDDMYNQLVKISQNMGICLSSAVVVLLSQQLLSKGESCDR
jgi:hypothetical protein